MMKKAGGCSFAETEKKSWSIKKHSSLLALNSSDPALFGLSHITAAFYPDVQEQPLATVTPSYSPLTCAVMVSRVYRRNGTAHTLSCLLF